MSVGDVVGALDLQPDGDAGRFRAPAGAFGGLLLAQVVVAAARMVPDKDVQSLHAVFARAVSPSAPLELAVEPIHVGRTFASVSVALAQGERRCAHAVVLLHVPAPDLIRHAVAMPDVPGPDDLASCPGGLGVWEARVVDDVDLSDPDAVGPPELRVWVRFPGAPDDPVTSQALLAYVSDFFLIGTAMRPHHGVGQSMAHKEIATTVLTQTLTFHEPVAAADWLLLDLRSTYAGRGRSYGRAEVFAADGRLVASFSQDNMITTP